MIGELAILPKVFREKSYAYPDLARVCLQRLFDCIRNEGVARDLAGRWAEALRSNANLHPCSREILEYLAKEGRLVPDLMTCLRVPSCDREWLDTALESHGRSALDLIVTRGVDETSVALPSMIADVASLERTAWWRSRSASIQVERTVGGYCNALRGVARLSRRLEFIDPYLNPEESNYTDFPMLLRNLVEQNSNLFLGVHVSESGSKTSQLQSFVAQLKNVKWKGEFELHVWKHFHDRFIVSNLIGIAMPKGLETRLSKGVPLFWTRLSDMHRRQVMEKYDVVFHKKDHLDEYTWRQQTVF